MITFFMIIFGIVLYASMIYGLYKAFQFLFKWVKAKEEAQATEEQANAPSEL